MILRPSSLPRAFNCPPSLRTPAIFIDETFDGVAEGNLLDSFARYYVESRDIAEAIKQAKAENISYLCHNLANLISAFLVGEPKSQVALSCRVSDDIEIKGTCDIFVKVNESSAIIIDVKAGFADRDYTRQLQAYAMSALSSDANLERVATVVASASSSTISKRIYRRDQIEDYKREIVALVEASKKEKYNIGEHCQYCPRRYECDAKKLVMSDTIATVSGGVANFEKYEQVLLLEKAIDKYKASFREAVESAGSLEVGESVYSIAKTTKEAIILNPESILVLERKLGHDLARCLKVSQSELKDLIMSKSERGAKKKDYEAFFDEMKTLGHVEVIESERLTKKKKGGKDD